MKPEIRQKALETKRLKKANKTIIPLDENWRIEADEYSWALAQRIGTIWRHQTWHRYVHDAILYYSNMKLRQSGVQSLAGLRSYAQKLKEDLDHIVEPFQALTWKDASKGEHHENS